MKAGTVISAWAGALKFNAQGKVSEKRSLYYFIQQLMKYFNAYDDVQSIDHQNKQAHIYKITKNNNNFLIAWYHSNQIFLPKNSLQEINISLPVESNKFEIEELAINNKISKHLFIKASKRNLYLKISHKLIYIFLAQ